MLGVDPRKYDFRRSVWFRSESLSAVQDRSACMFAPHLLPALLPVSDWLAMDSVLPGTKDLDAGWLEMGDVAGDDLELVGEGGGGDEAVGGVDGGACGVGAGE